MDKNPETKEAKAFKLMQRAFKIMSGLYHTRELAVSITNLETSIMWLNKDRTVKGELTPTKTHVQ